MPTSDEEFLALLRDTFKVEAQEHVQTMTARVVELEKGLADTQRAAAIETLYRAAHSLKGAARAVDLGTIESQCQSLEGVVAGWKRGDATPNSEGFDALHRLLDSIQAAVAAAAGEHRSVAPVQPAASLQSLPTKEAFDPGPVSTPSTPSADGDKAPGPQTVRIDIAKLEARLLQAEDMLAIKALTAQRAAVLTELSGQFEEWRTAWSKVAAEVRGLHAGLSQPQRPGAIAESSACSEALVHFLEWNGDFLRTLESRIATLANQATHDRYGVDKRVDELLADAKKLLMLPFSTVASAFPRMVRDICRSQGKQADLVMEGAEVEIDKRILEEMKDPLTHMLRNCVDHGVENPQRRTQSHKPARATITVAVAPINGSKVEIKVTDDGAGVDVGKVRAAAVSAGILTVAQAESLSDAEAMRLIFHSGVSTRAQVNEISGRGLGMAIVRAKAEDMGGTVSVESQPGAGTTLRITLPLTLATFRGILVMAAQSVFVVPTLNVERVWRMDAPTHQKSEARQSIDVDGRTLPVVHLDALLGLESDPAHRAGTLPLTMVVLHWTDQRLALAVDDVLHEEEVLVKPFHKPLVRIRNVAGATVLASGKVAPILNVSDLMKSARAAAGSPSTAVAAPASPASSAHILLVEDSITSRTRLQWILESEGYRVATALDGVDALAALRNEDFAMVITDVEMPRMNGIDLITRIRGNGRYKQLPLVLLTSLESDADRSLGLEVGANAYLGKSKFNRTNFLKVIHNLLGSHSR